jgi:hypothetical protein
MRNAIFWDVTPCIRLTFYDLGGAISQKITAELKVVEIVTYREVLGLDDW